MSGFKASLMLGCVVSAAIACTHGEPMPPRAERPGPPASVSDHPGFAPSRAEGVDVSSKRAPAPPPVCERTCPTGQHCFMDSGVERCVAD